MYQFQCDYNEGAAPRIIERLSQTNFEQTVGYGEDSYCEHARELIRKACGADNADVHFLVGGTQTNATVISSILRPHQGVLCAASGHINVHETGAIEHSAHKVLAIESENGLLQADQIKAALDAHYNDPNSEHMVQPGMVYISFPSEFGTLHSLEQLEAISSVCHEAGVPLFIDGARMGYGLCGEGNKVTLKDIARLADVFYIGGTKQGALFGEAVVITADSLKKDFRYHIKQGGGMLAKGRLLGLQFEALFEDNLYFDLAQEAVDKALLIRDALLAKGYSCYMYSPTNQQFFILPDKQIAELSDRFLFSDWGRYDEESSVVRICTSWATKDEAVAELIEAL